MEDQNELILKQMEETRTHLTEKVEAIEHLVSEKVQAGADVVQHATDAATEIVDTVKETVSDVTEKVSDVVEGGTEKVEETAKSVISVFDIRRHTERHPWVVFGTATTAGCMLGTFLGRRAHRRRTHAAPTSREPRVRHVREGNGHHRAAEPAAEKKESFWNQGWLREQLDRVKGLAIGALLSAVRDMAKRSVPGALGARLAEEVEKFTTHLGAEPIKGPVLPEQSDQGQENKPLHQQRPESSDRGTEVNRLRSGGGSGQGLR